jgi:hypothetical protein
MKVAHFGGEDVPLHANELRNPTTEQLDALSKFFREQQFARPAVSMSKSAVLPTGTTPLEIITGSMMNRYTDYRVWGVALLISAVKIVVRGPISIDLRTVGVELEVSTCFLADGVWSVGSVYGASALNHLLSTAIGRGARRFGRPRGREGGGKFE